MARERATIDSEEEQHEMFPELDTTKPEHKQLLKAARKFNKLKGERAQLLTTSKEKVDGAGNQVIALMHECKLEKFRHDGVKVEIIASSEKVEVEVDEDSEDSED